jgi:hypothetical protein
VNTVTKDFSGFGKLRKSLQDLTTYRADVGLFNDTSYRAKVKAGGLTDNPSIGFQHEFGNPETSLPERSFLRMPLEQHLKPVLNFDWFSRLVKTGAKCTVALLGVFGEDVVQEAFASGGYGQWPALKKRTIQRKGSSKILIETAQMRKAVTSRVV